ncbi:MAG: hypothetical protein Q7T26_10375 [Dehalococcoidia bacterium]|nr:hypothetical protein [Dehalococcoidia bacterium]
MTESGHVKKRYGMLRFIAGLLKVLAWVALVGFGLGALVVLATAAGAPFPQFREAGLLGFFLFVLYGVGAFVLLYLYADFIRLFLDMEENTRAMRKSLDMLFQEKGQPTPHDTAPSASAPPPAPERVIRLPESPSSVGDVPPLATPPTISSPSSSGDGPHTP